MPEDVVNEKLAPMLFETAKILVPKKKFYFDTKVGLDILVKYVSHVDRTDANSWKKAMIASFEEAQQKGLEPETDISEMITFLFGRTAGSV